MREKEFLPLVAERLDIHELNEIQKRMLESVSAKRDLVLISPTGSGKTLAFTLPLLKMMKPSTGRVQALILAPSRELVLQIAGVIREIAAGFKVTALYGGHKVEDEVNTLSITPDIIVATPGRLLDHSTRRNVELLPVRMLVIDEFDKCLELGFEEQMRKIVNRLKNVSRTILTSATDIAVLPEFIKLENPLHIDSENRKETRARMRMHKVVAAQKDKLEDLLSLLSAISTDGLPDRTIIFVNHRESAERVAQFLKGKGVKCTLYHGALEQKDREISISTFNAGSSPVMVATDLAARGLDIAEVRHIIHYHQPLTEENFIHRNGRTARVKSDGDIYLLLGPDEPLKPYVNVDDEFFLEGTGDIPTRAAFVTYYVSAGRKEKISRGDLLGYFSKELEVPGDQIGKINSFDHFCLISVATEVSGKLKFSAAKPENVKIKGRTARIWQVGQK